MLALQMIHEKNVVIANRVQVPEKNRRTEGNMERATGAPFGHYCKLLFETPLVHRGNLTYWTSSDVGIEWPTSTILSECREGFCLRQNHFRFAYSPFR